jgi:hypothetical protein
MHWSIFIWAISSVLLVCLFFERKADAQHYQNMFYLWQRVFYLTLPCEHFICFIWDTSAPLWKSFGKCTWLHQQMQWQSTFYLLIWHLFFFFFYTTSYWTVVQKHTCVSALFPVAHKKKMSVKIRVGYKIVISRRSYQQCNLTAYNTFI